VDPKDRLPAEWPDLDAPAILERLTSAGVDFVLVGGLAVVMHGYSRLTRDVDIAFASDATNLEALGEVLIALDAKLRGLEDEVPFVPNKRTLSGIEILTLTSAAGWIDVHPRLESVESYEQLRGGAERVKLDGFSILIAGLDDLIAMKRALGRPQDLADIAALEEIKRQRDAS
jgi:predicted nucleotidyltransferase